MSAPGWVLALVALHALGSRGGVVVVRMVRDDSARTYFEPSEVTARQGDTLRFVEAAGMHNVDFLPDSNGRAGGLPTPTPMLDTPGATADIVVRLAPGRYYFQCDPHVGRGMVGHLTVLSKPALAAHDTAVSTRDGAHDFDFEIGTWVMHRRRLLHPLTGSTTWVDPGPATHLVRPIWGGVATLAELRLDSPIPHFVGSLLHLYNPKAHQWSVSWVSLDDATVAPPLIGSFQDGRGVFIDQEAVDGRAVLVRVVYSEITATSFRTEQAFSTDGGVSWEVNAIDTYTRQ